MSNKVEHIYFNPPQVKSFLIDASEEYHVLGRGTGKSSGILASKIKKWATAMPRCTIVNVAATYQQHLLRTLPSIISGLNMLGWQEGRDFFIGSHAPKSWGWKTPRIVPNLKKYSIHFRTGVIMQLISQDVVGSANGMSVDAVVADEAKFINIDKFNEEVRPTMRGNMEYFKPTKRNGYMSYHHNTCMTTDMPRTAEGLWILDKKDGMDVQRCNVVMNISLRLNNLIAKKQLGQQLSKSAHAEILKLQRTLYSLRKGDTINGKVPPLIYYNEASSLENIHVLTPQYFYREMQTMDSSTFESSILNRRINKTDTCFYDGLSKKEHGYSAFNYSFLELETTRNKNYIEDCRQDSDLDQYSPLHISGDYGGSFNGLLIAQPGSDNVIRFLNAICVLHPHKVGDLVHKTKEYYKHHKRKEVIIYYDHTHIGENAVTKYNMQESLVEHFQDDTHGSWKVTEVYLRHTPGYGVRYGLWGEMLQGKHERFKFKFNEVNCKDWLDSCLLAPIDTRPDGSLMKVKTSEKRNKNNRYPVPQNIATHFSDAGDLLLFGLCHKYTSGFLFDKIPT